MSDMVTNTRHFDGKLWATLSGLQPRTVDNVRSLFWVEGGVPTNRSPMIGLDRNPELLKGLDHNDYRLAYDNAISESSLRVELPRKSEF